MSVQCGSDRILIHIGYHKTGSTWFQSHLFDREDLGFQAWKAPRNTVHRLFCDPAPFAAIPLADREALVADATRVVASGHVFVLSHERLSGYPASGGYDAATIAARLRAVFPNARILGLFRRQPDMILSAWRQQIVDGGDRSLRRFLFAPEAHIVRVPRVSVGTFQYSGLVRHYRDAFGAARTLFVPYEEFAARPAGVLRRLADLLELPRLRESAESISASMERPNPSLSPTLLAVLRCANLLFARSQLSPSGIVDVGSARLRGLARAMNRPLSPLLRPLDRILAARARRAVDAYCSGAFGEDNQTLEHVTGFSLAEHGYDLSTPHS